MKETYICYQEVGVAMSITDYYEYHYILDGSEYKQSLMVSETETEEEILFESSKKPNNKLEKQSLIPKNSSSVTTVRNNLTSNNKNNINNTQL